jgi:hypothetical protein
MWSSYLSHFLTRTGVFVNNEPQKNAVILVEYAPIELQARKLMGALANGNYQPA